MTRRRYGDTSRQKRVRIALLHRQLRRVVLLTFPQIRCVLFEKGHRKHIRALIVCSDHDFFLFIFVLCPENTAFILPHFLLRKYLLSLYIAHIRPVRILNIPHSFILFVIVNPLERLFGFNRSLDSFFVIFLIIIPKKGIF